MEFDKYIGSRKLPRGLICIRFEDLTLSNQTSYSDFLFEKPVTCFVLMIWQISIVRRFEDLTKSDRLWLEFVKSSNRQTKKSSRESFWFVVLMIWQIPWQMPGVCSKLTYSMLHTKNQRQFTICFYPSRVTRHKWAYKILFPIICIKNEISFARERTPYDMDHMLWSIIY